MNIRTKLALLAVMVIGVLPTAANAYACDGGHHDRSGVAGVSYTMERHHHGYGLLRASASYLGLSVDQLKGKLHGSSLAAVANATPGKSAAGLVDYLSGLVKTKLDRLVTAGKLTPAQESAFLAHIDGKLTKIVSFPFAARR